MGLKLYSCGMSVLIKGRTPLEVCKTEKHLPTGPSGGRRGSVHLCNETKADAN